MMRAFAIFILAVSVSACTGLGSTSITTGLTITGKSANLVWAAGTGTITGYTIEQSTDNSHFTLVKTVANVTTATIPALALGTTYYFRVKAYNAGGSSSASPVSVVKIQ